MRMPKILMLINEDRFFLSHRVPIAKKAQLSGYEVIIVAKGTGQMREIGELGFKCVNMPIDPTGMNPIKDIKTLMFICKLFKCERPQIVHLVGMKNILWGSLAARVAKVPGVVEAISGLGGLFNGDGLNMITKIILLTIRIGNAKTNVKAIFQNKEDMQIFLSQKAVKKEEVCYIKGSGVDLGEYKYTPESPTGSINVIFTARMVKEKGVMDLIEAAELIKPKYQGCVQFWLCGRIVSNATAITEEYMHQHCDGEYIKWLGLRDDIRQLLQQSHIMAFPSYYREGLPKSLIEASAIGRPIITCNSVGCKDVVDDGVNGFVIEPKDVSALANRLSQLIEDEALRKRMGLAARAKAERCFSVDEVVSKHMDIYQSLIEKERK